MTRKRTIGVGLVFFLAAATLWGAYLRNFPISVSQPDGWTLDLFVTGDEYYHWMHDRGDYTIVVDPASGYYVYAVKGADGELMPSPYIAGRIDPAALGLVKSLRRPVLKVRKETEEFIRNKVRPYVRPAPKTGTLKNLVVFIRFSGESEFTDPISAYSSMFNTTTAGYNSMHNYFLEASYNAFTVSSTFYPTPGTYVVSYQDSHARGYYQPYDATNTIGYTGGDNGTERGNREWALVQSAVNAIKSQVPVGLNIDGDNDGYVDNICFIIYGSPTGWGSLLWPHYWNLWYTFPASINGKQVDNYNFQLQTSLALSGVGVLCHEMCHSLGAPDLYHYYYSKSISPAYEWDIMDNDQNPPQHMGAYMKNKYMTWISSIPEITASGVYTLNPLTSSTGNAYKIKSPNSTTEYFVVEYRRQTGEFESSLPGTGLLVYRINTACGEGNDDGPPDEVYIYRPYGTTTANGEPDYANYSSGVGRTSINDTTNPSSFLSNGSAGGLKISAIGTAGSTISFTLGSGTGLPPTVTTTAVTSITSTSAVSGGNVTSAGGATVTARGVCWSTSANPTTSNSHTTNGTGTGSYPSNMTGLSQNTPYHVRAYATNSAGTGYGNDLPFQTLSGPGLPIPFSESFSGGLTLPTGWTQQNVGTGITERWDVTTTSLAGGSPNEARCMYQSGVNPGTSRLVTPAIVTTGYTSLRLSFKHYLNSYSPGGLTLKVRTSPNGTTWTDEAWSVTTTAADIGPQTVTTTLTHNLNCPTTYVAFEISGNLYNFDYWYIDNISIQNTNYFKSSGSWTGAGHGTDGWYVGDFNGDGKDDIFRYVAGTSGADVFLSNGTKFVSYGSWTGAGHGTDGWYVGDFNGDGKDDIFRYVAGTSGADVFLSSGTKFVYSGSWTGAGHGTDGWYIGDLNGDGRDDIFRYVAGTSGADVFLSDGTKFVSSGSWTGAGHGTDGWYVGDFNGGGITDIFRYVAGTSGADVFLSSGTKFVYSGSWTGAGHGTDGWYVGDFNGDNIDDIFRYVAGTSGADVFLSNGTKLVSSGSWTGAGHGTDGWYVGDFNGDNKDDIFRYVAGTSGADVFLSYTLPPAPSLANVCDEDLVALDADMMMDVQGKREGALSPQMEDALMAPFVLRMMAGEEVSVYEIQKAYEQALGHCVRRTVVLQLMERYMK